MSLSKDCCKEAARRCLQPTDTEADAVAGNLAQTQIRKFRLVNKKEQEVV